MQGVYCFYKSGDDSGPGEIRSADVAVAIYLCTCDCLRPLKVRSKIAKSASDR